MASVNKVTILGNVGQDPEVRYLPSGDAVANISVATTEKWKDKQSGEAREATEWHRISFFGRLAEIVGEYVRKGSPVYVEGSIHTRKYQDKDGTDRYATEIKGASLQLLGSRDGGQQGQGDRGGQGRGAPQGRGESDRQAPQGRGQAPQGRGQQDSRGGYDDTRQQRAPQGGGQQRPAQGNQRQDSGFEDEFGSDIPF